MQLRKIWLISFRLSMIEAERSNSLSYSCKILLIRTSKKFRIVSDKLKLSLVMLMLLKNRQTSLKINQSELKTKSSDFKMKMKKSNNKLMNFGKLKSKGINKWIKLWPDLQPFNKLCIAFVNNCKSNTDSVSKVQINGCTISKNLEI